ncbi:hypothetical protein RDABS01_017382 [Bienertia sinuspersici]
MTDQGQWVEDMGSITTAFTQTWSSKNLSYACSLQLMNSILMSISTYWCQLFLLPKAIIQKTIGSWVEYSPTQICSWVWKSFCKTKDHLIGAGVDIMEPTYSIKKVYESLHPRGNKIHWGKAVWCSSAVPKHQFMTWLAFRQRLLTRDRLKRMNLVEDQRCCLCNSEDETHSHLFFDCEFS